MIVLEFVFTGLSNLAVKVLNFGATREGARFALAFVTKIFFVHCCMLEVIL